MAFKSKSGQMYENHEIGRAADRSFDAKNQAPEADGAEQEEQPIEDSVSEHGPVEHIEMHSHHKDGHVHKSTHHDKESAHEHVDKAMGDNEESHEEPDGDEGMDEEPKGIPGMAHSG